MPAYLETIGNHLNIKYLKLVNHTASKRTEWSYKESCKIGATFDLHWAMNEDMKKGLSEEEISKRLERKKMMQKKQIRAIAFYCAKTIKIMAIA
ncbi:MULTISPECIES: hypothetical protein [unclassified Nostoc]|uniref:hypothetical protein n=1 Tax=unclassified Nostoc TaxID=2593658 RepID=UPI000B95C02C|nr:hypothetical protein [Nostoc sp. 'Peltigera membranacea cyanobiont' 232]OYE06558.1 hypothetical protein CDG79_02180 [Nostoc sp. 'Peltigera membranacea cyanobiont' 232]